MTVSAFPRRPGARRARRAKGSRCRAAWWLLRQTPWSPDEARGSSPPRFPASRSLSRPSGARICWETSRSPAG